MSVNVAWVIVAAIVSGCVTYVVAGLFGSSGNSSRREEVRDALGNMAILLTWARDDLRNWASDTRLMRAEVDDLLAAVDGKLRSLADLLGISRSVLDSWKTSGTDVAPVASTGDGGTASDAPVTALHESGTVGVAAGNYVKQSIASR
jgi:type II secretory pathway pseudopilin PulG